MKAIMMNGEVKTINPEVTIFNNQYITTEDERIFDKDILKIEDDIRLREFYCCSKAQGSYEKVKEAIIAERAKAYKCNECFWQRKRLLSDQSTKEVIKDENGREVIIRKDVYEPYCDYKESHHTDICSYEEGSEEPKLFREVADCWFCKHPDGIPLEENKRFIEFMCKNAEKYNLIPYWNDDKEVTPDKSFNFDGKFGSYKFEKSYYSEFFHLENNRNKFKFYFDFKNHEFILIDGFDYNNVKTFTTEEYDTKTQTSKKKTITNWDKFYKWFMQMVEDFEAEMN